MTSHEIPHFDEHSAEHEKLKYVIFDMSGPEPKVLAEKITDDPDEFIDNYNEEYKELNQGREIQDDPNILIATEDPSETIDEH